MALRTDLPKIPSTHSKGFFGTDTARWGMLIGFGTMVALGATGAGLIASPWVGGAVMGAFMTVGAVIGQTRRAEQIQHGKTVRDPSFLNNGIVQGITNGLLLSGALLLGAVGLDYATASPGIETFANAVGTYFPGVLATASTVLGITGGLSRRNQMKQDVALAENIAQEQQLALSQGRGRGRGQAQSFEMAQSVEQSQDQQVTAEDMARIEELLTTKAAQKGGHIAAAEAQREAAELAEATR